MLARKKKKKTLRTKESIFLQVFSYSFYFLINELKLMTFKLMLRFPLLLMPCLLKPENVMLKKKNYL